MVGSARRVEPTDLAVGPHDPVLLLDGRPVAIDRSTAAATRGRSVVVDAREVRVEGAVEVQRIDAVDPVELVAPLHGVGGDVPLPAPDVGQRLALAQPRFGLGQHRLGQALLGDVADHGDRSECVPRVDDAAQTTARPAPPCRRARSISVSIVLDAVAGSRRCRRATSMLWRDGRGTASVHSVADDLGSAS